MKIGQLRHRLEIQEQRSVGRMGESSLGVVYGGYCVGGH